MLDFLLLILWWIYFYGYLVSCWQYVSPNEDLYNRNYDRLYMVEIAVVVSVLCLLIRQSSGQWRRFYALYMGTVLLNYAWFVVQNRAIEQSAYFSGSWYDPPCAALFVLFVVVAMSGRKLRLTREPADHENRGSWMTTLAILAVLSLPAHRPRGRIGTRSVPRNHALQGAHNRSGHVRHGRPGLHEAAFVAQRIEAG